MNQNKKFPQKKIEYRKWWQTDRTEENNKGKNGI
jgi:hypothetical protein